MSEAAKRPSRGGGIGLVLASSSLYRKSLLERLRVPFTCDEPGVDERQLDGETAQAQVRRLAMDKARVVAARQPGRLIIASDQVCIMGGRTVGKPGSVAAAIEQLRAASGRCVTFLTSVCVMAADSGAHDVEIVPCDIVFRTLSTPQIRAYVDAERPLDCAGSFKSEGLGVTLFASLRCDDPTALVGLPLISVVRLLDRHGYDVFTHLSRVGGECRQP